MKAFRSFLLGAICAAAGCSEFFTNPPPNPPIGSETGASLKAFTSEGELHNYFRSEIASRNASFANADNSVGPTLGLPEADAATGGTGAAPVVPSAPPSALDASPLNSEGRDDSYSQTTTQEQGVDEADVVKTDGRYLYIIDDSSGEGSRLQIVNAVPAEQMAVVSQIPLEGYGRDLYLHDGKLVAITATYGGYFYAEAGGIGFGDAVTLEGKDAVEGDGMAGSTGSAPSGVDVAQSSEGSTEGSGGLVEPLPPIDDTTVIDIAPIMPPTFERPRVIVTVVDISNPAAPSVQSKTIFDGSPSASRMIDGTLHLVTANYQTFFYDVMPRLGFADFTVEAVDPATLLPRYERTDADGSVTSGDVLTFADLYHPAEPDGFGVVALVSMDINTDAAFQASGIVAEPGVIYSSLNALYLTNTNYDFLGNMRRTTDVYKFAYNEDRAVPVAAGSVPGRLLNQYSLGEHEGILRVATTVDPIFSETGQIAEANNNVYCLSESNGELRVMGSIENIAPRETIQAARFVGNRGYVVTFEQIDPLFTLDLSDPANPRIIGELKVPGFSTFVVPIDENHLLAVGQYIPDERFFPWGVQLSIFDVTDFANPVEAHKVILGGDGGAWSEALYDPKALTYFAERGLLALPASIYPRYDFLVEPVPIDFVDIDFDNNESDAALSDSVVTDVVTPLESGDAPPDAVGVGSPETIAVGEPYVDQSFEGLIVYGVSATGGFSEMGRISTRFEHPGFYSWTSFTRGIFIDETVYAVTNLGVRAAKVAELTTQPLELFYGTEYPYEITPLPAEPFDDDIQAMPFEGEDAGAGGSGIRR